MICVRLSNKYVFYSDISSDISFRIKRCLTQIRKCSSCLMNCVGNDKEFHILGICMDPTMMDINPDFSRIMVRQYGNNIDDFRASIRMPESNTELWCWQTKSKYRSRQNLINFLWPVSECANAPYTLISPFDRHWVQIGHNRRLILPVVTLRGVVCEARKPHKLTTHDI